MEYIMSEISFMIIYILLFSPFYFIFRYLYINKNEYIKKEKNFLKHELMLYFLFCFIVCICVKTIIPDIEITQNGINYVFGFGSINIIPFKIIYDILTNIDNNMYLNQFAINLFLFIPIGIILPLIYKKYENIKSLIKFSIIFSVIIGVLKLLRPKVFSIDDVLLNLLGIITGYLIYLFIKKIFKENVYFSRINSKMDLIENQNKKLNENNKNSKKPYAFVTGASSGIGYDIAVELSNLGFNIIAISRKKDNLKKLEKNIKTKIIKYELDLKNLSVLEDTLNKIYDKYNIKVIVNCAGFGSFGNVKNIDYKKELDMIDVNIKAVYIITKLYLQKYDSKENYILNVSSTAAFGVGPYMSCYYATKSFVNMYTKSIMYEDIKTNISCLLPGPVDTNFNKNIGIKFSVKPMSSKYISKYAVRKMFYNKKVIIPGIKNKILVFLLRFIPTDIIGNINKIIQQKKNDN